MSSPNLPKPTMSTDLKSLLTDGLKIIALAVVFATLLRLLGGYLKECRFLMGAGALAVLFGGLLAFLSKSNLLKNASVKKNDYLTILIFIMGWVISSFLLLVITKSSVWEGGFWFYPWLVILLALPYLAHRLFGALTSIPPRIFTSERYQQIQLPGNFNIAPTAKGMRWILLEESVENNSYSELVEIRHFLPEEHYSTDIKTLFQFGMAYQNIHSATLPFSPTSFYWHFFKKAKLTAGINSDENLVFNQVKFQMPHDDDLKIPRKELPPGFKWATIYVIGQTKES